MDLEPGQRHFYANQQLLIWYHASEQLTNAAKVLYCDGTPATQRWCRRWEPKLYQGHIDQLVQTMNHQKVQLSQKAEILCKESGYFRKSRKRMNYLKCDRKNIRLAAGWWKALPSNTRPVSVVQACAGAERVQSGSYRCVPQSLAAVSIKYGDWLTILPQIEMCSLNLYLIVGSFSL
jgi:hypothetical protein